MGRIRHLNERSNPLLSASYAARHAVMRSGYWYGPPAHSPASGAQTLDALSFTSLVVPGSNSITLDRIGIEVATGVATAVVRLGLYNNDPATATPSTLIGDYGTVDASTTGAKEITISQTLNPGLYWMAFVTQVAAANVRRLGNVSNPLIPQDALTTTANQAYDRLYQVGVSGALPATTGILIPGVQAPKTMVRVA